MFGYNDDFVKRVIRIFADEFVSVLREKGLLDQWDDFLSVEETAEVLGLTRKRMFELIEKGKSPRCYSRPMTGYCFNAYDIQEWIDKQLYRKMFQESLNNREIREEEAAEIFGMKQYYLAELRQKGEAPKHNRTPNGGAIVYAYSDIREWVAGRVESALEKQRKQKEA